MPSVRFTRRVCSLGLAASAATAVPWATGLGGSRSSLSSGGVTSELVRATGSVEGLDM
jgi:hypothetical protein